MTQLEVLKAALTLRGVAHILEFKPAGLSYILYKKDAPSKYTKFQIAKRYGGTREISAPSEDLKLVQRRLADVLQDCVQEINAAKGRKDAISHGFKRKRSIITNAREHRNRRYVFNVDLENFFGTINFGRVRGFFIKDQDFALNPRVATVLAQIACHDNALPQGSPCSPVVSNLIGHILDIHLARLAARTGCSYTRYVDDLTFSTNQREFPEAIAVRSANDPHKWVPGKELSHLIAKSGFQINAKKIRMQYRDSRQEVTGLIVNKKVNVPKEYRHTVRAMVHRLLTKGEFARVQSVTATATGKVKTMVAGKPEQLHGMLGFIDGVDLYNASIALAIGKAPTQQRSSREMMYRRFLLFKEFYAASGPVIVSEGKSDAIYLVHALRSLAKDYPQLATIKPDGAISFGVRIYKYSPSSTGRILNISEGTSGLKNLMMDYRREMAKFTAPGKKHPFVFLVDNDDGAKPIYSAAAGITKGKPLPTAPFTHVIGNMYILPTPLPSGASQSRIEDFFDPATKAIKVDGKSFDPADEIDTTKCYGKIVFAHKVVAAQPDKIDFSAFGLIFDNLVALMKAHAKNFP